MQRWVLASYPDEPRDVLLSGWINGADKLTRKAAAVAMTYGKGRIVLFGFHPQHRGQTHATFPMLFNAITWTWTGKPRATTTPAPDARSRAPETPPAIRRKRSSASVTRKCAPAGRSSLGRRRSAFTHCAVVSALSTMAIGVADDLLDRPAEDRIVRASEDQRVDAGVDQRLEVDLGHLARDVRVRPPLLRQRHEERRGATRSLRRSGRARESPSCTPATSPSPRWRSRRRGRASARSPRARPARRRRSPGSTASPSAPGAPPPSRCCRRRRASRCRAPSDDAPPRASSGSPSAATSSRTARAPNRRGRSSDWCGRARSISRKTVRPPTPESKTPIGLRQLSARHPRPLPPPPRA